MSLYNSLFGINDKTAVLLNCLEINIKDVPRFRDCYIDDTHIVIHTRTGGGNREYYENEETCRKNYPEYFDGKDKPPAGPWNAGLRASPYYDFDKDDEYDCTFANFYFKFPEEIRSDLEALAKRCPDQKPSEKWKALFSGMAKDKED
jgi:hypothetical protein